MSERVQRPLNRPELALNDVLIQDPPAELVRLRNQLLATGRYAQVEIMDNRVAMVREPGAVQLRHITEAERRAAAQL